MTVSQIIPLDRRRSKVLFEEGFAFALYRGEIERYHIQEGGELLEEDYQEILETILCKRARERVLHLLKASDRTEWELRKKLADGFYPPEAIEGAIAFLKGCGYIDDQDYGRRYVEAFSSRKSQRQICQELYRKGLGKETIQQALEGQEVDEEGQIRRYLAKKGYDSQDMAWEERMKAARALVRRGYSYEAINKVLHQTWEDGC